MFKKVLFVLMLAAAVVAFAGFQVPTASACSGSSDSCSPYQSAYGWNVPTSAAVTPAITYDFGSYQSLGGSDVQTSGSVTSAPVIGSEKTPGKLDNGPSVDDPTFNSISLQ